MAALVTSASSAIHSRRRTWIFNRVKETTKGQHHPVKTKLERSVVGSVSSAPTAFRLVFWLEPIIARRTDHLQIPINATFRGAYLIAKNIASGYRIERLYKQVDTGTERRPGTPSETAHIKGGKLISPLGLAGAFNLGSVFE